MPANGKVNVSTITRTPHGTVHVLVTDDPHGLAPATADATGPWYPAKNKRGMRTATITGTSAMAGNRRTRYDLTTTIGQVNNLTPTQTFWRAPAPGESAAAETPTVAPDAAHITTKMLQDTRGVRILIAERHEDAAGGGAGQWCAARSVPPRHGELSVPGEPPHVHAATVTEVRPSATPGRFDVVTNLGTVEGVTAGQRFRTAPDSMRDTVDIRAELHAERDRIDRERELDATHPRDVDRNRVAPGDLVELISVNRPGRPLGVVRMIRAYSAGGILVAQPYVQAYGDNPAGTSSAFSFRRLTDQAATGTAIRSCGCPAVIRDEIVPPPADGDRDAWEDVVMEWHRMSDEDGTHREGCRWYEAPPAAAPPPAPETLTGAKRRWLRRHGLPKGTWDAFLARARTGQVDTFDPAEVHIERHRASVTQGEVSVSYRGELLGRYGDDIQSCREDGCRPGCFSGYHGRTDQDWVDSAERTVTKLAATLATLVDPQPYVSGWTTDTFVGASSINGVQR
jgi:hypothetical protein